jgi:hypothetical protein
VNVLGYDLFLLDALRRHIRTAVTGLAAIRSEDPMAASAIGTVRDVQRSLELDVLAAVRAVLAGDPLGTTTVPSGAEWPSPFSAPAFEQSTPPLDDTGWACVFDDLATRRLAVARRLVDDPDDADTRADVAALDLRIAEAATRYAATAPHDGHVRWFPTALLDTTPLAAALVLRHLDLDDRVLAAVSALVLHRWREGDDRGGLWPDAFTGGDNTADVLFRMLADRPAAAAEFLRRAPADELLLSAQFDDTVARLLLVGTSPDHVDEASAGEVLRPLLEWLQKHELPAVNDGVTASAPAIAAAAVTPWLEALGPRAGAWGWTYDDGDGALRWLLDDPDARTAMAKAMTIQQTRVVDAPLLEADGRIDDTLLRDLAGSLAQVQVALRDADIDDAVANGLLAQLAVNTAGLAISAAVPGSGLAVAADVGVALLTPAAMSALDRWGLAPSPEHARTQAQATFGDRAIDTAVIAVTGIVGAAIDRGDLPVDTLDGLDLGRRRNLDGGSCSPREVSDRLHRFVVDLEPLTDAATHNALLAVLYAFANPLSDAQLCE